MSRSYKPKVINETASNIQVTSSCGLPSGDFSGINSASSGGSSKGSSKIYVCLILLMGNEVGNVNRGGGRGGDARLPGKHSFSDLFQSRK